MVAKDSQEITWPEDGSRNSVKVGTDFSCIQSIRYIYLIDWFGELFVNGEKKSQERRLGYIYPEPTLLTDEVQERLE